MLLREAKFLPAVFLPALVVRLPLFHRPRVAIHLEDVCKPNVAQTLGNIVLLFFSKLKPMLVLMLVDDTVAVVGVVVLEPEDDGGRVAVLYLLDELGYRHVADEAFALSERLGRLSRELFVVLAPQVVGRAAHSRLGARGLHDRHLLEFRQELGFLFLSLGRQGRKARVLCGLHFACHT